MKTAEYKRKWLSPILAVSFAVSIAFLCYLVVQGVWNILNRQQIWLWALPWFICALPLSLCVSYGLMQHMVWKLPFSDQPFSPGGILLCVTLGILTTLFLFLLNTEIFATAWADNTLWIWTWTVAQDLAVALGQAMLGCYIYALCQRMEKKSIGARFPWVIAALVMSILETAVRGNLNAEILFLAFLRLCIVYRYYDVHKNRTELGMMCFVLLLFTGWHPWIEQLSMLSILTFFLTLFLLFSEWGEKLWKYLSKC